MNQVLDTPIAVLSAAALLDPNSAEIYISALRFLQHDGAAETEDSTDMAGKIRNLTLSMGVFQCGGINGAPQMPADGAKLLGKAIPLKDVEITAESFEGLAHEHPFTFITSMAISKKLFPILCKALNSHI
jgi:hypothetical protein